MNARFTPKTRLLIATLLGASIALAGCGSESNPEAEAAAHAAALPIAEAIDRGEYAGTYTAAAPLFRESLDLEAWEARAAETRSPLGEFERRALNTTTYVRQPWGQPETPVTVVTFDSFWENGDIHEMVTMQQQSDGSWLMAGYHVRQQ